MQDSKSIQTTAVEAGDKLSTSNALAHGAMSTVPWNSQWLELNNAVKEGVKEALKGEDTLIGYPELARRMQLKERLVRRMKNAGIIHAALDLGKVVRFHWPSVLEQLKASKSLLGKRRS